jgi:hypothetical protein
VSEKSNLFISLAVGLIFLFVFVMTGTWEKVKTKTLAPDSIDGKSFIKWKLLVIFLAVCASFSVLNAISKLAR